MPRWGRRKRGTVRMCIDISIKILYFVREQRPEFRFIARLPSTLCRFLWTAFSHRTWLLLILTNNDKSAPTVVVKLNFSRPYFWPPNSVKVVLPWKLARWKSTFKPVQLKIYSHIHASRFMTNYGNIQLEIDSSK